MFLYCCSCIDKELTNKLSVQPPNGLNLRTIALNCGLYCMARGKVDILIDRNGIKKPKPTMYFSQDFVN